MGNESKTYLTLNGTRLECQWFGQPDADRPVLVLLHEGLGCVEMWRGFPRRLAQQTGLAVFRSRHPWMSISCTGRGWIS
jgi:hypothetical protein